MKGILNIDTLNVLNHLMLSLRKNFQNLTWFFKTTKQHEFPLEKKGLH